MITLQTDRDGAVIRIHDDAFDREPSYRMQQISQIVSSHYKRQYTFAQDDMDNNGRFDSKE